MTDKTPAKLADEAAEAIRAINHLTQGSPRDDWEYPGDVYSLVANLSQMAMMLPQALEQASHLMNKLNEGGHLRSDKDTLDQDLGEVFYGLDDARNAAQKLYGSLNRAHNGLGPIGYKD
ncbi:hypothetical protein QFZ56_008057 [Streptomyces achromogenes]|uniref:Uncharacterized protein n=1 Tax=Streptomyces achromogenes TaxID=67255 RepID=A0ABU0QF28_STRAH|nr:hypothetical protein [Streptomyces achromogenes]MDQ0689011.1 hypothetical protein [Streptomyces achromogenes]